MNSGQETALRDSLLTYFKKALTDLFVTALASSGYPMITSSIQSPIIYAMSERPTGMPISKLRTNQPSSSFQQSPPVSTNFRAQELRTEASFIARISVTHVSFDWLTLDSCGARYYVAVELYSIYVYCNSSYYQKVTVRQKPKKSNTRK